MATREIPDRGKPGAVVPSLADVAQDYIRDRITGGDYSPGYRLKERDLVEEIGISRIPLREALRSLATEGFVTLVPRKGAVVTQLKPNDLEEIFEVREALETHQAVLATRKATQPEVAELFREVEASERAWAAGDRQAADRANVAFHAVLVQMTHNDLFTRLLEPLQNRLNWLLRQNADQRELCLEHRDLAEAIAGGDEIAAQRLARQHVHTSKRVALELLFGDEPD
ncbi:MAG: GntR family transcriptional regulator [Tessaracoccus sp.]|uniref:GntR family transcriptional regulator n=1 Tax=Tessaracoccus sp. TaxID=1971211 RepID=UPI001ED38C9C|nr:GntR family transcriptional regulator [Tessaracoccus sp.]MBK7821012.1 GntR family transcriptional regulator [Tessaracoccus sp.]